MSNTPHEKSLFNRLGSPVEIWLEKQSNKHSFATMGCICGFRDLPVSLKNKKIHVTAKARRCYGPHFISCGTQQTLCGVTKAQLIRKICFLWISVTGHQSSIFFFNVWQGLLNMHNIQRNQKHIRKPVYNCLCIKVCLLVLPQMHWSRPLLALQEQQSINLFPNCNKVWGKLFRFYFAIFTTFQTQYHIPKKVSQSLHCKLNTIFSWIINTSHLCKE